MASGGGELRNFDLVFYLTNNWVNQCPLEMLSISFLLAWSNGKRPRRRCWRGCWLYNFLTSRTNSQAEMLSIFFLADSISWTRSYDVCRCLFVFLNFFSDCFVWFWYLIYLCNSTQKTDLPLLLFRLPPNCCKFVQPRFSLISFAFLGAVIILFSMFLIFFELICLPWLARALFFASEVCPQAKAIVIRNHLGVRVFRKVEQLQTLSLYSLLLPCCLLKMRSSTENCRENISFRFGILPLPFSLCLSLSFSYVPFQLFLTSSYCSSASALAVTFFWFLGVKQIAANVAKLVCKCLHFSVIFPKLNCFRLFDLDTGRKLDLPFDCDLFFLKFIVCISVCELEGGWGNGKEEDYTLILARELFWFNFLATRFSCLLISSFFSFFFSVNFWLSFLKLWRRLSLELLKTGNRTSLTGETSKFFLVFYQIVQVYCACL